MGWRGLAPFVGFTVPPQSQMPLFSFPIAQTVKNLPAMQETRIQFLVWEDPLEKGMASHSNVLAWKIPWTEEPGKLQSAKQRVGHN